MTAEAGGLFAKVVAASRLITHVPKNGFNAHHKFYFASHDDVTDVCKAAMDTVGLCLIPVRSVAEEVGKLTRVTVTSMLADPDTGQVHMIEWQGEGADAQDKALYKALTQAKKTVLLNLFLIPTGDYEADGDYGHGQDKGVKPKPQAKPTAQPAKPSAKAPQMFADLEKERQDKARAKFWALANDLFGDNAQTESKAFCKGLLTADESGAPSLRASTVQQVSDAIKALEKHHLAHLAATGPKN